MRTWEPGIKAQRKSGKPESLPLFGCAGRSPKRVTVRMAEEVSILTRELQNFQVSISDNGFDGYNARVGTHDDLVLALAMALWIARRPVINLEPLDAELTEALCEFRGRIVTEES